jgi:hypothetical protein
MEGEENGKRTSLNPRSKSKRERRMGERHLKEYDLGGQERKEGGE